MKTQNHFHALDWRMKIASDRDLLAASHIKEAIGYRDIANHWVSYFGPNNRPANRAHIHPNRSTMRSAALQWRIARAEARFWSQQVGEYSLRPQ